MVFNDHLFTIDSAAKNSLATIQEINAVIFDVQAHQVATCPKKIMQKKLWKKHFFNAKPITFSFFDTVDFSPIK